MSLQIHGFQNEKMAWIFYILYLYINDVSFILMMFWCEVHTIYMLAKYMQLSWCNFA